MKKSYSIILGLVSILILQNSALAQDLYTLLPININTKDYAEESAVPYKDGIIFISNRSQSALRKITDQNGNPLKDIFFSRQKENKKWTAPDEFSKSINSKYDELSISVDKDGKLAFFTRLNEELHTEIYMVKFNGIDWDNITPMPFNNKKYNFFDPCLSDDGKKLFFASNRPGGLGGSDIWVVTMGRSAWGPPKNLGSMINSDTSDITPFYHRNGKLYFASNRKGSNGGMDIYWSMEINGQWLPAKPLPTPFNTKFNDFSFVSDSLDRAGFITSDRGRSQDIFSFLINVPEFKDPKEIQKNSYKFRFRETSIISDSSTFLYEWDFGDKTKIRGRILDVIHKFPGPGDYMVTLNVIDSLTGEVYLNQAANALQVRDEKQPVITCPDTIYRNEEIIFDSEKSYLPDLQFPVFFWDMGDGTLERGKSIKHIFYYPGEYKVLLGAGNGQKDQPISDFVCVYKKIIVLDKKIINQ